jgi:hypothetical protein
MCTRCLLRIHTTHVCGSSMPARYHHGLHPNSILLFSPFQGFQLGCSRSEGPSVPAQAAAPFASATSCHELKLKDKLSGHPRLSHSHKVDASSTTPIENYRCRGQKQVQPDAQSNAHFPRWMEVAPCVVHFCSCEHEKQP